jgi:murein DD-endopeptidase MepM/ murein hydrolase activator NlpD
MTETFDVELARTLAKQGGLGLAALVERGLDGPPGASQEPQPPAESVGLRKAAFEPLAAGRRPSVGSVALAPDYRSAPVEAPVAAEERSRASGSLALPLDVPVSSRFGWRADPFHGAQRFHAGLDLRAAYGREVPAAAAGRVSFAGQQGGYGLTVVVDHENGVQTRYAHLSAISVQTGQELAAGEVIGRVGQTGRATGPHLHFEVALDGRKVDPTLVAERVRGGLKTSTVDDDFPVERVPAGTAAMGVNHED